MSAQFNRSHTALVVDMKSLLEAPRRKRVSVLRETQASATLLSMRQNLRFHASVALDDPDKLSVFYSDTTIDKLTQEVRAMLNVEFGRLRVYRYRKGFTVGHPNLEGLIGSLLRIQFHARQLKLPVSDFGDEQAEAVGIPLSWGVGGSVLEADNERLRRFRR